MGKVFIHVVLHNDWPLKGNCDFKSGASEGQSNNVLEGERGSAIVFPLYKLKYANYLLITQAICKCTAVLYTDGHI